MGQKYVETETKSGDRALILERVRNMASPALLRPTHIGLVLVLLLFVAIPVSGTVEALQGLQLMEGMVTADRANNNVTSILAVREIVAGLIYLYAGLLIAVRVVPVNARNALWGRRPVATGIGIFVSLLLLYTIVGIAGSKWLNIVAGLRWYYYLPLIPALSIIAVSSGAANVRRLMLYAMVTLILLEFGIALVQTFRIPWWFGVNAFDHGVAIGTFSNPNALGAMFAIGLAAVVFILDLHSALRIGLAASCAVGVILSDHLTGIGVSFGLMSIFVLVLWYNRSSNLEQLIVILLASLLLFAGMKTFSKQSDLIIDKSLSPRLAVFLDWAIADTTTPVVTPVPTSTVLVLPTATVPPVPTATATAVPTSTPPPSPTAAATAVPTATVPVAPTATSPVATATPIPQIEAPDIGGTDAGSGSRVTINASMLFGKGIGTGTNTLFVLNDRLDREIDTQIVDSAISGSVAQFGVIGTVILVVTTFVVFGAFGARGVLLWVIVWILGATMVIFETYPANILIILLLVFIGLNRNIKLYGKTYKRAVDVQVYSQVE